MEITNILQREFPIRKCVVWGHIYVSVMKGNRCLYQKLGGHMCINHIPGGNMANIQVNTIPAPSSHLNSSHLFSQKY